MTVMHRSSSAKSGVGVFLRAMPVVVLLAVQVVFQAAPAGAAPGDLDPAFGEGGRVITGYDGPLDDVPYCEMDGFYGRAYGVAIQADGKIIVLTEPAYDYPYDSFSLVRLLGA